MTKLLEFPFKLTTGLSILLSVVFGFFGLVAWVAARQAIIVVAPIVVWSLAIMAIVTALGATITCSEWFRKKCAELGRDKTLARNEARQADIATNRQQMHLMAEGRMMAAAVRQIENGLIHPSALGEGAKFSSFPTSVIKQIESELPQLEVPPKELLPAIRGMQNLLIIGGKGTGKTTLLQHLESERIHEGQTIALDSHAVPGQWTGQSIGAGRNYGQIKNAMIALVDKMDARHKERTAGKVHFEPVHTLIDEFTLLPGYLKDAGYNVQDYSFPMLTEGRKTDMACIWGSHSDRAKPLGLEGLADLRECFDVIIYLKKTKGEYYAVCDFGEGKEGAKYTLPGAFIAQNVPAMLPEPEPDPEPEPAPLTFVVAPEPEPEPEKVTPSEAEDKAIMAFVSVRDSGKFSMNKAAKLAFGENKTGVFYHDKLKKILDKFNIDYSEII